MSKGNEGKPESLTERPPVVVIMGHIDHGKSTLLDYIRKENTVEKEAGGITQHISAYEIEHEDKEGKKKRITFIDTPGHEAFSKIRSRGARVGDVAVLVVAADDGVKVQTMEALSAIQEAGVPFMVAVNKIDKPGADVNRTIASLIESGVYIEGYGGDIPWNAISAKSGEGVDELLDTILLIAELEELAMDPNTAAEGTVIETRLDPKAGISATLLIKNGTLKSGQAVWAGGSIAPVRIMKNYAGKPLKEASASSPVEIVGFDSLPQVGAIFKTFENKKEALEYRASSKLDANSGGKFEENQSEEEMVRVPFILKCDVSGSEEAVLYELEKLSVPRVSLKLITTGIGDVSENDVRTMSATPEGIIIGFNVRVDGRAADAAERLGTTIKTFSIIYELAEWIEGELKARSPRVQVERITGRAKILKTFNRSKNKQIIGGKVLEGTLDKKARFYIVRRDERIGAGTVEGLQTQKVETDKIIEGTEFGGMVDSKFELAPGDVIETFVMETEGV
jgi:translation initiation factor IF-2